MKQLQATPFRAESFGSFDHNEPRDALSEFTPPNLEPYRILTMAG
jgi:hypothetical protein